jgi:hypothetical protein
MKKEVVNYIARCLECQKMNIEHRHPTGFLHPFPTPEWKWEVVTIDFITKLPKTMRQHDFIMLVMGKLMKDAHIIPMKTDTNIAKIYMKEVGKIHGVPKEIVSDKVLKFTSNFWKGLFKIFGTNFNLSISYHP